MINPWSKKNSGADLEFDFGFDDKRSNARNSNLIKAKQAKNDEFYTQLEDIEAELSNYPIECFKDKVVYCPCDVGVDGLDTPKSNFIKYFEDNKDRLEYKKLIHTSLQEGYDFRSDYCTDILKESDIVVTNPPFSLFREFVAWLMKCEKKFIVIGNQNAITYKEFFPLLRENKVWIGYNNVKEFKQPDGIIKKFGNICWFTNVDINKRHEKLIIYKHYTPEEYPKYDNYCAWNVDKVKDIFIDDYIDIEIDASELETYKSVYPDLEILEY